MMMIKYNFMLPCLVRQFRSWMSSFALIISFALIAMNGNCSHYTKPQSVLFQASFSAMHNPKIRGEIERLGFARLSNEKLEIYTLELRSTVKSTYALSVLKSIPGVKFAEPGRLFHAASIPNDPRYYQQTNLAQIGAERAWDLWKPQSVTVVALIDTGIALNHPDLISTIFRDNTNTPIMYNSIDNNSDASDDEGHGTAVAGIGFASIDNGIGMAGIAGWNPAVSGSQSMIRVMPIKALNSFRIGTDTSIANGITWAVDHGANVINMSFFSTTYSATVDAACQYAIGKGCVVVAAAGNDGTNALEYPASNNGVISVGAIESNNTLIPFSNYGSRVDIVAPGRAILTTTYLGDYDLYSGTSAAAPQVAAAAAMIMSEFPNASVSAVTNFITTNTSAYFPYQDHTIASGGGRLNVYAALLAATQSPLVLCTAPASISAERQDKGAILNWSTIKGAAYFGVFRGTSQSGPFSNVSNVIGSTTFIDHNLTNGTTYYYRVAGVNEAGVGQYSNIVSVIPQYPNLLPGIPVINFASTWGINVLLKWTGVTRTVNYIVNRSIVQGGPYDVLYDHVDGPSFQDISAVPGTTYYYVVQGNNSYGIGDLSNEVRVDVYSRLPVMPTGLTASQFGRFVSLSWDGANRSVSYSLYRSSSPTGQFVQILTGINGPSVIDTTVARSGGTYYYQVQGVNGSGAGPLSSIVKVTTAVTPPGRVQVINVSNRVRTKYISWTGITMASSYTVKRGTTASGPFTVIATNILGPAVEDYNANPNQTFYYIVVAVNSGGNGPDSAPVGG